MVEARQPILASGQEGRPQASDKTASIRGGVILEDGRIEINCSIEALVASCRNELAGEVAKILFN